MKKVTEYFAQYPGSNKCHQTSDGLIFHEDGDAHLHARSLVDKTVIEHKRGSANVKALAQGMKAVVDTMANIGKSLAGTNDNKGQATDGTAAAATLEKPAASKTVKPAATKGAKPAATKGAKPAANKGAKPAAPKTEDPADTKAENSTATKPEEEVK